MSKFGKFTISVIISIFMSFSFSFATQEEIYVWSSINSEAVTTSNSTSAQLNENFLNLTSGSAILVEANSGQILYEHNIHEQLRPASVTKIMTLLLIMEALDNGTITLQDNVPCSENASSMGGSQIWLDQTETLTVDEMLKAICVVSANDASVAMAEFIAGSQELFVEQMNKRAKELGMNDTCFKNCHGIDEDGHLTSSYDISIMSRELLNKHPSIVNYTSIWMDSLRDGKSSLVNTNKLLRNYSGCIGLKTGSTSTALFNISAVAKRNDLTLIAVIMRGETSAIRFSEAQKLLDYGFSNFEYAKYCTQGNIVQNLCVDKGVISNLDISFSKDAGSLVPKGKSSNIEVKINLPEKLIAPISKGQKIGEATFLIDGNILDNVDLIADNDIKKINVVNMLAHVFENWFNLIR